MIFAPVLRLQAFQTSLIALPKASILSSKMYLTDRLINNFHNNDLWLYISCIINFAFGLCLSCWYVRAMAVMHNRVNRVLICYNNSV